MVNTAVGAECDITGLNNLWQLPYTTPEKASLEPQSNYAFAPDGTRTNISHAFFAGGYLTMKIPGRVFGEREDEYPDGHFHFYGILDRTEEEMEVEWRTGG
jgi:hypothetical protein